ncbi:hypothetical protein C3941_25600 [Kaistia algarum]|uniref:DUF6228 family protein n=1 Tax=Kaistia algarum TaxID=2083279 RepID=UPI000CE78B12|nr:DUF6228 family protein [Kaistia algarum]PPE77076.1 hypothetical protein C3941_25600 [Kaistia algarum]
MTEQVRISSAHGSSWIEFGVPNVKGEVTYFEVTARFGVFSGANKVSADPYDSPAYLFEAAAEDWTGYKFWNSDGGELSLRLSKDSVGHCGLEVRLHEGPLLDVELKGGLLLELGSLDTIAGQLRRLFAGTPAGAPRETLMNFGPIEISQS